MRTFVIASALLLTSAFAQAAPRTWHFTCDYYSLDVKGNLAGRQRYSAFYTRGLPGDLVRWNDVTVASSKGWSDDFGPAEKQDFMEGFSYPWSKAAEDGSPDFFRGFPSMSIHQRNLVWDTHMFEGFATEFDHLKPTIPYHVPNTGAMNLAGAGTFRNRDLQLVLTGNSKRNGQDCAVIDYRAFFNTIESKTPAFALVARSDYWGQIWVSLATKEIEYATLYEEVLGELTLQGQQKPATISVVRVGVFEPAKQ